MDDQNNIPYDAENDVNELNDALKGGKEKDELIVEIICSKTNEQRQELKEKYKASFGENLDDKLEKKLSGDLKTLILGLMKTSIDFDTDQLYLSMKGLGTDEAALDELIITRPYSQLEKIAKRYPELHEETLEKAIVGDTSDEYQKILIAMISGERSENPYPNTNNMKGIVYEIRGSKEENFNVDKCVKYFAKCSFGEICTISRIYEKMYQTSLFDDIQEGKFCKDFKNLMKRLLVYIADSGRFFAEIIHKFDKNSLNRIMISRSEIDMDDIRDAYKDLYNKDLIDEIREKISDEFYCKALTLLAQK